MYGMFQGSLLQDQVVFCSPFSPPASRLLFAPACEYIIVAAAIAHSSGCLALQSGGLLRLTQPGRRQAQPRQQGQGRRGFTLVFKE